MSKSYFRKTDKGKYLSGRYTINVNHQTTGEASRLRTSPSINIYIPSDDKLCKLESCKNKIPQYTKTGRIYKSEFCKQSHRQIYIRDLKRTKPKVYRGTPRTSILGFRN